MVGRGELRAKKNGGCSGKRKEKKELCWTAGNQERERGASGREGRRYHSLHVGTYGKVLDREGEGR